MAWTMTADDIGFVVSDTTAECPITGTQTYTAEINNVCVGAYAGQLTGNWTVMATFEGDMVTGSITNGSSTWEIWDTCGTD
jgi:hypothetical protein